MGFNPQQFFIGVIDLFSVLLPGMIATFVLDAAWGDDLLGEAYADLSGAAAVAAFLVIGYLLGHFIFLVGSWILDRHVYDPIRKAARVRGAGARDGATKKDDERAGDGVRTRATADEQDSRPPAWAVHLSKPLIRDPRYDNRASSEAEALKRSALEDRAYTMNAFQWSKASLLLRHPSALSKVERFEADSKFFRSLTVLFPVMVVVLPFTGHWTLSVVVLLAIPLSLWRYVDQRLKSVTHAFWYVIVLDSAGPPSDPGAP